MKKALISGIILLLALLLLSGCASPIPMGVFYTDVTFPVTATASKVDNTNIKVGTAKCNSYLGLIAVGDASIDSAVKRADITDINHVEWQATNFMGIFGTYKVLVYGE